MAARSEVLAVSLSSPGARVCRTRVPLPGGEIMDVLLDYGATVSAIPEEVLCLLMEMRQEDFLQIQ